MISSNPKDRIGITKVPLHLVPLSAQIVASLAHLDGSLKYGPYNWRHEKVAVTVYIDACLRHVMRYLHGQNIDPDSGLHNLGHALATLNILIDAEQAGNLVDDRPKPDGSPDLIDKYREEVIRLLNKHGKGVPNTPTINQKEDASE